MVGIDAIGDDRDPGIRPAEVEQPLPQRPGVDDVVGGPVDEEALVLPGDGAAAAAGGDDGRQMPGPGHDPAPDVGNGRQKQQQIGPLRAQRPPQGAQAARSDARRGGQPAQGNAGGDRRRGEVPAVHQHPELGSEPGPVQAGGQGHGLALGAAKGQILK